MVGVPRAGLHDEGIHAFGESFFFYPFLFCFAFFSFVVVFFCFSCVSLFAFFAFVFVLRVVFSLLVVLVVGEGGGARGFPPPRPGGGGSGRRLHHSRLTRCRIPGTVYRFLDQLVCVWGVSLGSRIHEVISWAF